ncbi:DUF4314 domain-containing protein [Erysipelothrix rhusiopathiae]|nr:DUF4314 domain-containing protein [Erysipelothrix rhusiopathiae]
MNQFEILRTKELYKAGTKVRCLDFNDEHTSIPEGTLGVVKFVDDIGTIHVSWENGSNLGVVIGIDTIEIVKPYRIEPIPEIIKNAHLERKQDSIITETAIINHAVILDDGYFETFKDRLLDEYDFIKEMNQKVNVDEASHEFVVINESHTDGILVASEGYDYARYSAHLSNIDEFQIPFVNLEQEKEQLIKVLVVEPNNKPYIGIIENNLESLQAMVGGLIEEVSLSESASIIANEEGKLLNLSANLRLGNDVLAGRFIIVGVDGEEHFKSLSPQNIEIYQEQFQAMEEIEQSEVQDRIGYEIQMLE